MLEHIGLLDDRFFLYSEDVEWSMRARVRRALSASSGARSDPYLYFSTRNPYLLREHAPMPLYTFWLTRRLLKRARHLLRKQQPDAAEVVISGIWAGLFRRADGECVVRAPRWFIRIACFLPRLLQRVRNLPNH